MLKSSSVLKEVRNSRPLSQAPGTDQLGRNFGKGHIVASNRWIGSIPTSVTSRRALRTGSDALDDQSRSSSPASLF